MHPFLTSVHDRGRCIPRLTTATLSIAFGVVASWNFPFRRSPLLLFSVNSLGDHLDSCEPRKSRINFGATLSFLELGTRGISFCNGRGRVGFRTEGSERGFSVVPLRDDDDDSRRLRDVAPRCPSKFDVSVVRFRFNPGRPAERTVAPATLAPLRIGACASGSAFWRGFLSHG